MKTTNFSMDLMVPSQLGKDIVFNESLLKIDSFMNCSVSDFIDHKPEQLNMGEKFIISNGEHKNKICYKPLESKTVLLHEPKLGMLVFVIRGNFFLIFSNNGWEKVAISGARSLEPILDRFIDMDKKFLLSPMHSYHYLYLNTDTEICIEQKMQPEISIIIKQSANGTFNIKWPDFILWEQKHLHIMTPSQNSMDLIKLYQLPESKHLFGKIIAQNFIY
jgi:hypothetical protein